MRKLPVKNLPAISGKALTIHEYEATGESLRELIDEVKQLHSPDCEIEIHPGFIRICVLSDAPTVVKVEQKKRR